MSSVLIYSPTTTGAPPGTDMKKNPTVILKKQGAGFKTLIIFNQHFPCIFNILALMSQIEDFLILIYHLRTW